MKIEPFVCTIEKLQYKSFENKSKFSEDPIAYVCNATVSEVGRGMTKHKTYHNVTFYLTEEQYNAQIIEKKDRMNILEGAKWQSSKLDYMSFNPETIKKADPSKLQVNEKGQTYYKESVYAYKVVCKQGTWDIKTKYYDQNYCTIFNSRLKLPLEDKEQFKTQEKLEFFLDQKEMELVRNLDAQTVRVVAYSNNNKFAEKNMLVDIDINKENGTYYLAITGVDNEEV